jgi:hydroxymethylpyrimidine/phosphomethylpyrimidine kinase
VNLSNPSNHGSVPYALSIAGFDPSAGAGVLADAKTFEANGVYGFGVITANTWQNDVAFEKVEWIDVAKIEAQIAVLLQRFSIRYVKIGLIENAAVLDRLVNFLHASIENPVIVYDPIIRASAGFAFHADPAPFRDILQHMYCVTPNIPEAEWLFGTEGLNEKLEEASEYMNIYLKGGHSDKSSVTDMLYVNDHTYVFANDRLANGNKHGSGCVLSAALTAQLAAGKALEEAAEHANLYTHQFLASSNSLLGFHKSLQG